MTFTNICPNKVIIAFLIFFVMYGCTGKPQETSQQHTNTSTNTSRIWRGQISLRPDVQLPFRLEFAPNQQGGASYWLVNGKERLEIDEYTQTEDSLELDMHIFNTRVKASLAEDGDLKGYWIKDDYADYTLPFAAEPGTAYRFSKTPEAPVANVSGKWEVTFTAPEGEEPPTVATGVLEQEGTRLLGTFLTTTGDYRFLEGEVNGDKLRLSCFDGEHAFLFTATVSDENTLTEGVFYSGRSWKQPWSAIKNEQFELPDANSLTYLKEGYEKLAFSFPNLDSTLVSLEDARYQNKVVVVQLMGSWCPNCMDETLFFKDIYPRYQPRGLEIISLGYERDPGFAPASKRLLKVKQRLGIKWPMLVAGPANKAEAAETLPMLNHVMSFPTTIIIDRAGKVRNIHTGFSGPGTGVYYERFAEEFTTLVEKLLAESPEA